MKQPITLYTQISNLLTTIGNPVRVQILLAIGTGEACVCHLESLLELRQAYISQQLMILRKQKIINSRREGKYVYYQLLNPEIVGIIQKAGEIAGVQDDTLAIQNPSNCKCPKCKMEENITSRNSSDRGKE
ncbi:MAG: winged helix-turn-helix transcriptional regulator [Anaerolineales bacterium]|uniref:Winged helix-turn-helix transcriptional regulator n=1 Tax=Candidatus Desulfolinea nitratireducens TaxID=2841698 RepID=A0A8J6NHQ7_9CHLR|nr:winged helix-turn-helix transcriptional regulator [Candidatus Desulfolinea nitratireducens]MBL6960023.1 winged helix-turn-helix transcriptional regulator [Anaerolineales bacterium]